MNWQPIDTAPKDGTVILTNDGICKYRLKNSPWAPKGIEQWLACYYDGNPFTCVEEGPWECSPTYWMALPPLPKA
jgi:hypothetical protein